LREDLEKKTPQVIEHAVRCSAGQSDSKVLKGLLTLNGQVGRDDVAFVQNLIAPKRDNIQERIEGRWECKKNMYG
jgi:hypothetical protein